MSDADQTYENKQLRPPEDAIPTDGMIVVGVGASAGGLEALGELLEHLPADSRMAFVLVQHLDPHHESVLAELLSAKTPMRVVPVQHTVRIEAGHVYIISPNTSLRVRKGHLVQEARPAEFFKPIDIFFESLAEEFRDRAIGIVLSGTATDGTLGLKRIKGEGGITFAQNQTAKFDSMPRSAVAAGVVDFVLSPRQIAEELASIVRRPEFQSNTPLSGDGDTMHRLLGLLRHQTGVDFNQYKLPTIARRLTRRMLVRKSENLEEYFQQVQKDPAEVDALFDDLLINVTEFFRDPDVFETAKQAAFPSILENRKQPHTIRAWIPGCSTGEEVYSLAIALTEFLEANDLGCAIQMFGTDVSERIIEAARRGIYSEGAVLNVSQERLRRFFVRRDSGYQVSRGIRDLCIFSRHNLAKDPPLSRMDVISCRNLLIYFSPSLQRRVTATFSYALQPGGCLILGPSETLGSLADHFSAVDEPRKVYRRKSTTAPQPFHFHDDVADEPRQRRRAAAAPQGPAVPEGGLQRYVDRVVLSRYGPSGVVIDESWRITGYRGAISDYMIAVDKAKDADLMAVVRPELRAALSTAIEQAGRTDAAIVAASPAVPEVDEGRPVAITVIPLSLAGMPRHFLILLARTHETPTLEDRPEEAGKDRGGEPSIEAENANLKQELRSTREYLQSVIEELRSTNEEAQSANEELQSTNEEMQTSKEELQSANEELNTINSEMQSRNAELARANDDLINLLGSMNMPIVMTGRDLRIRRFTPVAEKVLRMIPTDIGRPDRRPETAHQRFRSGRNSAPRSGYPPAGGTRGGGRGGAALPDARAPLPYRRQPHRRHSHATAGRQRNQAQHERGQVCAGLRGSDCEYHPGAAGGSRCAAHHPARQPRIL